MCNDYKQTEENNNDFEKTKQIYNNEYYKLAMRKYYANPEKREQHNAKRRKKPKQVWVLEIGENKYMFYNRKDIPISKIELNCVNKNECIVIS